MKYLKKILFAASLAVASLGFTSFSANAVLITQSIESDVYGTIATVTVDVDDSFLNNGLIDSFFSPEAFTLVDLDIAGVPLSFLDVQALAFVVDGDNIFAGLESFFVDAFDTVFLDVWQYQLFVDGENPDDSQYDVFDVTDPNATVMQAFDIGTSLSFGRATVVSEPATLAIFGLALAAMGFRRRAS